MYAQGIRTLCIACLLSLAVGCTDLEAEAQKLYQEALSHEEIDKYHAAIRTHRKVLAKYGETKTAASSIKRIALLEERIDESKRMRRASMTSRSSNRNPTGAALMTQCAETFKQNLDQFKSDVGRYPTTGEGLRVLARNPGIDGYGGSSGADRYLEPGFLRTCERGVSQVSGAGFAYRSDSTWEYTLVIE